MPTHELHITFASNSKRIGGSVSLGFSRLSVALLLKYIHNGYRWSDFKEAYPQINHDEYIVLKRLYDDLVRIKLVKLDQ